MKKLVRIPALAVFVLLITGSFVAQGQTARPQIAATDTGGANPPSSGWITAFEVYRNGLYWWKSGATASEIMQREGTLVVKPSIGLRDHLLIRPSTRYLGRGYGFEVGGAVRDDLYLYYSGNGHLRRKPLGADLAEEGQIMTEVVFRGDQFVQTPIRANGAVMLWKGNLWHSYSEGGTFSIRRGGGTFALGSFSGSGTGVKRMAVAEVLNQNGTRLKDSLIVLTREGRLYQFDLDPLNTTAVLLAQNVSDFAIRNESFPGGGDFISRTYSSAIYAGVLDLSANRPTGRLLRIDARTRNVGVEYDTRTRDNAVTAVAADDSYLFITVTPLTCGAPLGCSLVQDNSQILSKSSRANSGLIFFGEFATIVDRVSAGAAVEGLNLRSDGQWLYWITGNRIWRIPRDTKPIERDFEAIGLEVVQTTQDLNNTTRLVANKPTFVRAYARLAKDSMGLGRYTPTASLRGILDNRELGTLRPINHPVITSSNDLGNLRSSRDNGFLFELPQHWVQRGRLQLEFTVNHTQAIPETGQNPLANNRASTQQIEVIQMGSPCLVFVPIHTRAPDYSPHDPNSGFAEILFRAESLLPVSGLRFAIKSERISKPVVRIKYKRVLGLRLIPYPVVELDPFDVSEGFNEPMLWLKLYSAFHKNPAGCEDTHYVGTVHWTADTNGRRGLATRPSTGVAEDSIVKMEPRGSVPDLQPWDDPRGGRTLAHELGHNYTLRHIDQTTSGFDCDGGAPENSESYPYDTCTIGILDAANLNVELASRSTQYGFDPISLSVIKPDDAGDLMSYRSSRWTSKATLDRLFGRIPGFQAPGAFAPAARHSRLGVEALPASVILVHGSLDLAVSSGVLWPAYRLPSSEFDPKKILNSMKAQPSVEGWHIRLLNAAGVLLAEYPLDLHLPEDGDRHKAGFVQFIPDHPEAARLQLLNGAMLVAETGASLHPPMVVLEKVEVDAGKQQLFFQWAGEDPDGDLLFFTLQFSPDDGESWQTLQANYGQQSYATSTRLLPGGDRARVRVIATDGFHSSLATSQPFVLEKRPPEILLSGIKHGDRLPVGQHVMVQAIAYDPEDGNLDPAFLQWSLRGTASFDGTGGTISLQDLPPGLYQLNLSATDSDQQTGAASVQFEIGELVVPESSTPELDGLCGDPAYANAPVIRIPLGGDNYSTVRLIHAGDALYACFSGLNFATGENQFAAAGLRVDRNFSRDKSAQADDAGFFVDETGIPWQEAGNGVSMARVAEPQAGFSAVISQGDEGWSAELRISDSLLGGWNHQAGVMLVHSVPGLAGGPGAWPTGASGNSPASWGPAVFGPTAPPANIAPMASAGVDRVLTVAPGEVLYLDGSGSYDPEGATLTYSWTQIEGPAVTLVNPAHSTPAFVVGELDRETLHRFRLVVSDGSLESAPAETTLTLRPSMDAPETLFQQASISEGGGVTIQLLWPGEPGDLCVIQASTDLMEWEDLGFTTVNHLGFLVYSDIQAGQFQQRYYRGQGVARPEMPAPRYALAFDGLNDSVDVPHHAALNAFPITISAWIRTSNSTELVRGIVSKYLDGSLNGYSLFLYGGHLRAWYFRNGANAVFGGGLGLDGGFVADGELHHVVFVVDAGGGRLYVDGEPRASRTWAGSSGAPSTSAMLRIGRYHAYPQTHEGLIDEVSIWNIALTPEQIRDLGGESLTGSEAGLRAFWPFDEGSGPLARDATGHGHEGHLQNGPVWTEFAKERAN